ncbi:MAG: DUF2231 domain-containing protein [Cytophagaceae bacterium]
MRSKANFRTHPIHPMLIPFPIAFLSGTLLFHLISVIFQKVNLWEMGNYLSIVGIFSAIAAAIPGAIDYFYTVPPNSSGKKHATKHALSNITSVVLFTSALFISFPEPTISAWAVLGIEMLGIAFLVFGGWLGGTLAYRNQIGVDHRYAGAGKWKEEYLESRLGERVMVAKPDELKVNQMKLIHLDGKRIVIGRTDKIM